MERAGLNSRGAISFVYFYYLNPFFFFVILLILYLLPSFLPYSFSISLNLQTTIKNISHATYYVMSMLSISNSKSCLMTEAVVRFCHLAVLLRMFRPL